jgi:transposase
MERIYLGIDWGHTHHDACWVDALGHILSRVKVAQTIEGMYELDAEMEKLGVSRSECWVGLETAHTLVIDFLWERGYVEIRVVPPGAVKALRRRYRQTNAHTDESDAWLIADILRTDPGTLRAWRPDSVLIRQMRVKVSQLDFLTKEIGRKSNRLWAVVGRYYPAALHVFAEVSSPISLLFLQAYPTPEVAGKLTLKEFSEFARSHRYRQADSVLAAAYARLQITYPQASAATVTAYSEETSWLTQDLLDTIEHKKKALKRLQELFEQHPDHSIFASLPGVGDFLAPALLAKFGDDRQRFPSPGSLQSLAGTCPVTEQSGKGRLIYFRQACDHEFRQIVQYWAKASVSQSSWAATYWHAVWQRSRSASHAYRCLGNRWLSIAWKCWQSHQAYDEALHLQNRAKKLAKHK